MILIKFINDYLAVKGKILSDRFERSKEISPTAFGLAKSGPTVVPVLITPFLTAAME